MQRLRLLAALSCGIAQAETVPCQVGYGADSQIFSAPPGWLQPMTVDKQGIQG